MLQTSEKEKIELRAVVNGCVEGYKLAYGTCVFESDFPKYPIYIRGVPEYIAQLLDKLVANAVEFSRNEQPIRVYCRTLRDHATIKGFKFRTFSSRRDEGENIRFYDFRSLP